MSDGDEVFYWNEAVFSGDPWVDLVGHGQPVMTEESIRRAIERYGVNTRDRSHDTIFSMICNRYWGFTEHLIDVVFEYHPIPFIRRGVILPSYLTINAYVLQKFLEQDYDYKFNRLPGGWDDNIVCGNMLLYMKHLKARSEGAGVWDRQIELLSNHMNKWITFFDMMKHVIIKK